MRDKKKRPNRVRRDRQKAESSGMALPKAHQTKASKLDQKTRPASPISIVGIGASAGGLEAFQELLQALPDNSGMGFVLVQHLAPKHESILSELLSKATKMPVVEVREGMAVKPNHVYVIPPNADMSIQQSLLHLSTLSPDRARRMPIDMFLRSLAEDQQGRAIGVILSGTASDGTLGLQAIKAHGGVTFAQDEGTAKFYAMPRSAVAAGNVDFVLPPERIGAELNRIAEHIHIFVADDQPAVKAGRTDFRADQAFSKILLLLRNLSRVDFSYYKQGTVKRRITRRMFLRKIDTLEAYLQCLRKDPNEVEALFSDILINVTGFFRDPEAFDALKKAAFPRLLDHRDTNSPVRISVHV